MYGLVLEGGGAKGAYHIGVFKALREMGINIGAITGTSIGAINGAMFICGNFDEIYDLWYNAKPSMLIKGDETALESLIRMEVNYESLGKIRKYLMNTLKDGGLDMTPLKAMLRRFIDETELRNSDIEFGLVTVSLTDLEPLEVFVDEIPWGKVHDYIMNSANLPVFKMERTDGKLYIDGAFFDNLPINLMASRGYKKIIAVETKGAGLKRKVNYDDLEIITISPSGDLGRTLEIDSERTRHSMKLGYYDAYKAMQKMDGFRYYLKNPLSDDYFYKMLSELEEHEILAVGKILGLEERPARRMLFEGIIPALANLLDCPKSYGYKEIVLAYYEYIAEEAGIDRFQFFDSQEFLNKIHSEVWIDESMQFKQYHGLIPKTLKNSQLFRLASKRDILVGMFNVILESLEEYAL